MAFSLLISAVGPGSIVGTKGPWEYQQAHVAEFVFLGCISIISNSS